MHHPYRGLVGTQDVEENSSVLPPAPGNSQHPVPSLLVASPTPTPGRRRARSVGVRTPAESA